MQLAPAVSVTGRRRGAWAVCQSLLTGLAAAVGLGWLLDRIGAPGAWVVGLVAPVATWAAWLSWRAGRHGAGRLDWDGAAWRHWPDPDPGPGDEAAEGIPTIAVDLGGWMLLRFRPRLGRTRWLALARTDAAGAWPALRRAVLAAAKQPPTAAARP